MMEISSARTQVDDIAIRYWIGGQGPTILLLHSAFGDAEFSWSPVWSDLAKNFTVIAPDLPGFGLSDSYKNPSIDKMASSLKGLTEVLKINSLVLIGNSFGASVAIAFTQQFPKLVRQVILVDGVLLPSLPEVLRKMLSLPAVEPIVGKIIFKSTFGDKAIRKAFPLASPQSLKDLSLKIGKSSWRYFLVTKDCVMNLKKSQQPVRCRVDIIWGSEDRLTPIKLVQSLERALILTKTLKIKDAGHLPQRDQPEEFVKSVLLLAGHTG
jgi:pimeloyl-ACP methyl ester carboxylesterase